MKIITLIITASLLTISMNTVAEEISTGSDLLVTEAAETKHEAYQMGLEWIDELKAITPRELSYQLHTPININRYSLHVQDGCYVIVEERMNEEGDVDFYGLVNINYGYIGLDSTD